MHIFPEPLENRLQAWWPFTPTHVCTFPKNMDRRLHSNTVIKIKKLMLIWCSYLISRPYSYFCTHFLCCTFIMSFGFPRGYKWSTKEVTAGDLNLFILIISLSVIDLKKIFRMDKKKRYFGPICCSQRFLLKITSLHVYWPPGVSDAAETIQLFPPLHISLCIVSFFSRYFHIFLFIFDIQWFRYDEPHHNFLHT